jgi:DNA-binding transcriptional LysR family regulator
MAYVTNLKMFVRVYELGSMSAAARDQRASPAVASSRIAELEKYLGVRLFNRTTRALSPTEHGRLFYDGACQVLESIDAAEAAVMQASQTPRGTLFVAAPLGIGRRIIAPAIPAFKTEFPQIDIRLRLSDRAVDVMGEGLDMAFHLGPLADSDLKVRTIADCDRVLCAAPAYIAARGNPADGTALVDGAHDCLNLRFPGAQEFQWTLQTPSGPRRFDVRGPLESDDGDVLTAWALEGCGIIMKPIFEVSPFLAAGALIPVATATPPVPTQLVCLTPSRKYRDPKVQLFAEKMIAQCREKLAELRMA